MAIDANANTHPINETLDNAIRSNRKELKQRWLDRLRAAWGPVSEQKISVLQQAEPFNLLDVALKVMSGKGTVDRHDVDSVIRRVRCRDYSISDVFTEFICLEEALDEFLPAVDRAGSTDASILVERFKQSFCGLFGAVLQQTAEFYEHVIEQGETGFCQTDEQCRIVYANPELRKITEDDHLIGKSLTDFFVAYERDLVRDVLVAGKTPSARQSLNIRTTKGTFVPVGVELARVFIGGKPMGGYAHITDISKPVQLQNEVFDNLQLGIIRVNSERKITFMNKSLREMLDIAVDAWQDRSIDWLAPDDEVKGIIERQLDERFGKGKSDEYEARFLRMDGKPIPVKITAAPEKAPNGKVIRTIGVVRSMVLERLHELIEREHEPQKLLQSVMEEIQSAIPYDRVYVAMYSQDRAHVRALFRYSINGTPITERRWWATTPSILAWAERKVIVPVPDIEEFYEQEEFRHLKSDPAVQEILENFSSFIYYPVFREGKIVACAVFYSKHRGRYGQKDRKILEGLPLDSAILMALHYEEKKNLEFLLDLSKEISRAGDNMQKIAHILVDYIASYYDWENVALFEARRAQRHFHLLSQRTSEDFRIPDDFTQPFEQGILGHVYRTRRPINVDDVQKEEFRNIYEPAVKQTRSELCIPIESGELFWLLNIEDPRKSAFSKDEELALVRLIDEVCVFLERTWLRTFLDQSLLSTSDAVWVTDNQGRISRTNPAALRLLKSSEADLVGCHLAEILREPAMAARLIESRQVPNVKIGLRTRDGNFVNVLLSKFRLQEYFRTNVYIAKDLSAQERLEELEYLGKMYYEIATQTQTPLTLVFGWLERLGRNTNDANVKEILDRTRRQLRKIELTYNRLSLYDKNRISEPAFPYNEVLCNIEEIWKIVAEDLPQNELQRIETRFDDGGRFIFGDLFQLSFCLETILSYLIRFLPEDEKIHLQGTTAGGRLQITIQGCLPGLKSASGEDGQRGRIAKTLAEMALGEEIITKFIQKHRGRYSGATWTGDRIEFSIRIPLAEEYAK